MNALPIGTKGCWPCKAGGDEEEEGEDDDDVVVCCCFRTWGGRGRDIVSSSKRLSSVYFLSRQ